jgi:hypothetical protein
VGFQKTERWSNSPLQRVRLLDYRHHNGFIQLFYSCVSVYVCARALW